TGWRLRPAVEVAVAALFLHALEGGVAAGAAAAGGAAAAAGDVLDQAIEEAGVLLCQRLPLFGRGLRHRRLYRQGLDRLAFQGACHDAVPEPRRQATAGHPLHAGPVVIAHPDANDELCGEADEPGVAGVLRGSRLAAGGSA